MQNLNSEIIKEAKKLKMQELEKKLRDEILGHLKGEIFVCPYCNYTSRKNPKGSATRFKDAFKCFACGIWRAL